MLSIISYVKQNEYATYQLFYIKLPIYDMHKKMRNT